MIRRCVLALAVMLIVGPGLLWAETPRAVWVKEKCALCHGIDGSGQTTTGIKVNAPDLRAPKTRKLSDEVLTRSISGGHKRMPSFRNRVSVEKARLLLLYLRELPPSR